MRKTLNTTALSVLPLAMPAVAFASECDFNGVMEYFMGSGILNAILSFLTVGVMLFFALTKKSIPGILGKILKFVSEFLGGKPSKP